MLICISITLLGEFSKQKFMYTCILTICHESYLQSYVLDTEKLLGIVNLVHDDMSVQLHNQ